MRETNGQFKKGVQNPNKRTPIIGMCFGELTVISDIEIKNNDGRYLWEVECSCGTRQFITSKRLFKNARKCTKCMRHLAGVSKMLEDKNWKKKGSHSGVGSLTLTHIDHWKQGARRRNKEWNLSVLYLWELYEKQNKKCALSGLPIAFSELGTNSNIVWEHTTASLDRIDSSKGYVEGNVQWLHKHVNVMKNQHSTDYFLSLCAMINNHVNPEPSL